ncbi:MAG: fibronectin type III domain-containing protein [Micromonosporaceae bacterium]|nr:fibronectin type III domain-containing protein [Micromonosporaceae bacterium]
MADSLARPTFDILDLRLRSGGRSHPEDPCCGMVLSWTTHRAVAAPRVLLTMPHRGQTRTIHATTMVGRDPTTGAARQLHRARLTRLMPGARYTFLVTSEGATPIQGSFRVETDATGAAYPAPARLLPAARAA